MCVLLHPGKGLAHSQNKHRKDTEQERKKNENGMKMECKWNRNGIFVIYNT
jgi:hypothetical protein